MSGFDDPRYVEQQFKALQKKVDDLERKALPFAAHQRGPLPGSMRAVALNDQGLASSMWMNFNLIGPGSGPYWAVTDANKVIRVEGGNLAARGISPAQQGLRVNDASANPIFDSLGLIGVMSQLGQSQTTTQSVTSTTDVLITGSAVTFSLTRAQRVLLSANATATATNNSGSIDIFLDGVNKWQGFMSWGTTGVSAGALVVSDLLAAGSHTYDLRGVVIAGVTLSILGTILTVWLLGS